ncbi:DUF465 domain-containing protein [candidate division CSSED10-310 bacterium]|uniref:DUF465 domain-containing protein n=1 Tax=candidate division CSSED10-310 bacterium TaxID=2855610 RepID=A0ABV6YYV5_UNCC1
MRIDEAVLKEKLIHENPDFAKLAKKHREYDRDLQQLAKQPFLTPDEQIKETQLKKMKLKLKDEMAQIMWAERKHV